MTRFALIALVGAAVALAAPAAALAAPPTVTTGAANEVSQTTAVLRGSVNPKGNPTFTFFQYGTSKLYGAQTPQTDRGSGGSPVTVADPVAGLAPFTVYHYRLVAQHGQSLVLGQDRTFKTDRQPLGVSLAANPATVFANGDTALSGTISGTGNGGRQVILMANPFPFQGFFDVGNAQIADAAGNFTFPVLDVPVNTIYRVRLPSQPDLVSPDAAVNVKVVLDVSIVDKTIRRGEKAKFRGRVAPSNEGAEVLIQRQFHGEWVTVKRTQLGKSSRFATSIKPSRGGRFRVAVTPGTAYVGDESSPKTIKVSKAKKK